VKLNESSSEWLDQNSEESEYEKYSENEMHTEESKKYFLPKNFIESDNFNTIELNIRRGIVLNKNN
jgi:hypothetical protein